MKKYEFPVKLLRSIAKRKGWSQVCPTQQFYQCDYSEMSIKSFYPREVAFGETLSNKV